MAAKLNASVDRINQAADSLGESDKEAVAVAQRPRDVSSTNLQLDAIIDRDEDLRPLNEQHVRGLAGSIALVGLISPPAVDLNGQLIAGGHRRAALKLLRDVSGNLGLAQETWSKELLGKGKGGLMKLEPEDIQTIIETWKREGFDRGIPVRKLNFVVKDDADRALAAEIIENTQREAYTRDEVLGAYEKLKKAGYKTGAGRPKKGEKALMPALGLLFGRHVRTLRHVINDGTPEEKATVPKTLAALKAVKRALRAHGGELPRDLKTALRAFEDAVDEALEKRAE